MNKVIIIGGLGKDPEIRYGTSGAGICSLSVATSTSWVDKASGERKKETEWHNVTVFGKQADLCAEHLVKGSKVAVEGRLKTEEFTDKTGNKQRTTKIIADNIEFLSPKNQDSAPANGPAARPAAKAPARQRPAPASDDFDDSIPF